MKKILVSIISLLSFTFLSSAMEWGGLFTEDIRANLHDFSKGVKTVTQSNGISLWGTSALSSDGSWYVAGQTSYKYFADFNSEGNSTTSIFDIDLAKLNGTAFIGNSAFSLAAGRYQVSDLTSKIFTQNCDGLSLKFTTQSAEFSVYGGYTGLLNSMNVKILNKDGVVQAGEGSLYTATHKYVPVVLSVERPSFGNNQSFNLQLSGMFDMEDDPVNRLYGSLMFTGPIFTSIYYNLGTTLMTTDLAKFGNLTSVALQMFLSDFLTVKIGGDYASGKNFIFQPFVGFTSNSVSSSTASPELTGVITPYVDLIFTVGRVYSAVNGKVIVGCPDNNFTFNGIDCSGTIICNIFSDLQLGATGTMYYDMKNNGNENNYSLNINVSLAF